VVDKAFKDEDMGQEEEEQGHGSQHSHVESPAFMEHNHVEESEPILNLEPIRKRTSQRPKITFISRV
jgi:hypothetical protein